MSLTFIASAKDTIQGNYNYLAAKDKASDGT
jgi:hypothetical protein